MGSLGQYLEISAAPTTHAVGEKPGRGLWLGESYWVILFVCEEHSAFLGALAVGTYYAVEYTRCLLWGDLGDIAVGETVAKDATSSKPRRMGAV